MLRTNRVIATVKIPSLRAASRTRFCPEYCRYERIIRFLVGSLTRFGLENRSERNDGCDRFQSANIDEFHAKNGLGVGSWRDNLLLMTSKGAKTNQDITTPLVYR